MIPVIKYIYIYIYEMNENVYIRVRGISVHLTTAWVCVSLIGCSVFLLMCNICVRVCTFQSIRRRRYYGHSTTGRLTQIVAILCAIRCVFICTLSLSNGAHTYIYIYICTHTHTRSGVGDASRCMCACTWHFDDGDTDDNAHMGCVGCM